MSEQHPTPQDANFTSPTASTPESASRLGTAKIIYFLYLASLIVGITGLIGLVMAYINKDEAAGEVACNHYRYQIRTFWIGMLYGFISMLLMFILIGWLLLMLLYVWVIVRCVKGIKAADRGLPIENVTSWLF